MGNFEHASELYRQVLTRRPKDVAALKGLAMLLNQVHTIPTSPQLPIVLPDHLSSADLFSCDSCVTTTLHLPDMRRRYGQAECSTGPDGRSTSRGGEGRGKEVGKGAGVGSSDERIAGY
jgi:hypothetical protein